MQPLHSRTAAVATLTITLPRWLQDEVARQSAALPEPAARMAWVIDAARRNVEEGSGGPFAAAVFECDSGRLVAAGVNLVLSGGLSLLHAEMLALAFAQRRCGTHDLGAAGLPAHQLVTSSEPCAMCYGALPWSGVRQLLIGARAADAEAIGFDEGVKPRQWRAALASRGITTVCDLHRDAARQVLRDYAQRGGAIYNPRQESS